jgi:3alpha(or 20beta)-hydroxysteroid dehydrogenase
LAAAPGLAIYCASKAAVHFLTKALAIEVGRDGIRVNSVHPGMTQTDMLQHSLDAESPLTQAIAALPLGRAGTPDEVAAMVAFLASGDATYCAGGTFVVDGGLTAI